MIDLKKIAVALRRLVKYEIPSQPFTSRELKGIITDIADELDPPEPKPLLADAKVGDLCRLRNGGYTQIDSVKRRGGKTWYDRTDGYTSYPDGRLFKGENNEPDIIHTEPIAEVGTAEWAWQMTLLGKDIIHCEYTHGTGYEIDEQKKEPEKESPVDPIERPLRSLILRAKEEGKNIRTYYQDMVFTPCALDGLLADGKFRWWNISNWELTNREQNYYPQISYDELNPESAFKAGDWVEIEVAGVISQHRVKYGVFANSINAGGFEFYGNGLPVMKPLNARIIRKLDPSEVRIKVTLEGTVSQDSILDRASCFSLHTGRSEHIISLSELVDSELVESLLKAQEEK